jgi:hypothetical protein
MKKWVIAVPLLAAALGTPGAAAAQESIGAFIYTRSSDAITDADESTVSTKELSPTPLRTARLVWRCDGQERIELFVSADEFLDTEGSVSVVWRFDKEPPSNRSRWGVSRRGTAAFAPEPVIAEFSDAARRASGVVIRVSDYRGVEYDLRFSMAGSSGALDRLPCAGAISLIADEALRVKRAEEAQLRAIEERRRRLAPPEGAQFVGNPNTKAYLPLNSDCWMAFVDREKAVFFRTREDATRAGYKRSSLCRR